MSILSCFTLVAEAVSKDRYGECCLHGKVVLPFVQRLPRLLHRLYNENDFQAKEFRSHVRRYNKAFAFASSGGSFHLDGSILDGRGPPCHKIQGELYHRLGPILPSEDGTPSYSIDSPKLTQAPHLFLFTALYKIVVTPAFGYTDGFRNSRAGFIVK